MKGGKFVIAVCGKCGFKASATTKTRAAEHLAAHIIALHSDMPKKVLKES